MVLPDSSDIDQNVVGFTAQVYPNPSVVGFNLVLKSSIKETVEVIVRDVMGNGLYHARGEATSTYNFGGNFISGIYFVEIIRKEGIKVLKVMKQ